MEPPLATILRILGHFVVLVLAAVAGLFGGAVLGAGLAGLICLATHTTAMEVQALLTFLLGVLGAFLGVSGAVWWALGRYRTVRERY